MPDAESISLSLDELRAVVSAVEEHPPALKVTLERYDEVVIAKWASRPADAGTAEGGHGGGQAEIVMYRGKTVAEHVRHAPYPSLSAAWRLSLRGGTQQRPATSAAAHSVP
jgi:hypothetical protein